MKGLDYRSWLQLAVLNDEKVHVVMNTTPNNSMLRYRSQNHGSVPKIVKDDCIGFLTPNGKSWMKKITPINQPSSRLNTTSLTNFYT